MTLMSQTIFWIFLALQVLCSSDAARIFFMIPLTTASEKNVFVPLIDALAKKGHDVTVASVKKSKYESKTIKEFIPLPNIDEFMGDFSKPLEGRSEGIMMWLTFSPELFEAPSCEKVYNDANFKRAINEKYDLVVVNSYFQYCFTPILPKLGAPFVVVSSSAPRNGVAAATGGVLPASFVPNPLIPMTVDMNFGQRTLNFVFDTYWRLYEISSYGSMGDKVAAKYLGEGLPRAVDIEKNASLVLTNSHFVLNWPVPALPDMVEVGGMHCVPPKPLPKDLDEFISGAKDGLVYFSLGSVAKSEALPEDYIKMFISAFSKLKQRVLWKLGGQKRNDLPPNLKVSPWCPQQDILGHPKTKLFISHGGLLSTQEAIYHGVPVVGIPLFMDQDTNMMLAEAKGFAKKLELLTLDEETLLSAINGVLNDESYRRNAKEMSRMYRDQPQTPLDRAVFWVEYVIRHKGARHMRSAARDLNIIQYYCLDVISAIAGIAVLLLYIFYAIIRKILVLLCGRKQDQEVQRKKRR